MPAKLKSYTLSGKLQPNGRSVTTTVHARSKVEARKVAEKKYNYKLYGITVKGPY